MNLNGEVQMYAGALVIVMFLAVAIGIIALRSLNEQSATSEPSSDDKVIALETTEASKVAEARAAKKDNPDKS